MKLFGNRTRVLGNNTLRATPNLNPKGRGNKSMVLKQKTKEGCYDVVLQALHSMVKAELLKFQSLGMIRTSWDTQSKTPCP